MIPQLKCFNHPDQDIIMITLAKDFNKQHRTLCTICLEKMQLGSLCQIKNIPFKTSQFAKAEMDELSEQYNSEITRLSKIRKLITTLRDKQDKMFENIIETIDDLSLSFKKVIDDEQMFYQDVLQDITLSKLEDLGDILSSHKVRDSRKIKSGLKLIELGNKIAIDIKPYIDEFKLTVNQIICILKQEMVVESDLQLQNICDSLASNQKQSMIVGGVGNNIIIWEQKKLQLVELAVLTGHTDIVTAIVIFSQGDMIISGSGRWDKSLKLWKKTDNKWNFIQTLSEHTDCITDIKLTSKEDQVISTSKDKSIKVWSMNWEFNQLHCVQTLNEHTWEVLYTSICPNQQFMATSSNEKYFIIFKSQTKELKWKKLSKIETEGKIHRIHFIDDSKFICQQVVPPKLIIYEQNQQNTFQVKQEIILNEPDNNNILFPILECKDSIYCKNENFGYLIKRSASGKYYIGQIITGLYWCGCVDISHQNIIMGNKDNKKIEFYGIV